jgi:histidinol-phosphate aminotransferase
MSKAFGLAGARVGYAIAPVPLAGLLDRLRPPGSISTASAALAVRALGEREWLEEHLAAIGSLRALLADGLASLGLEPIPSSANFVLCEIGQAAGEVAGRLMDRGVVVRSFGEGHPLERFLRFTVRLPDQQDRMLEELGRELP